MDSFCEYLYSSDLLKSEDYQSICSLNIDKDIPELIDYLRDNNLCESDELLAKISEYFNISVFDTSHFEVNLSMADYFELSEVEKYGIIALKEKDKTLYLGTLYPLDPYLKENIRFRFKSTLKEYLLKENDFQRIKKKLYSNYFKVDEEELLKELSAFNKIDSRNIKKLKSLVDDAPVVKLLNKLIEEAVSLNASDIHLETKEQSFEIRYRIDGILKKYYNLTPNIAAAVISRIKIISGMDITIRHLPQDGKMEYSFQDIDYDIRSSVIPTIYGEKAVLRLLLRNEDLLTVDNLNFTNYNQERFKKILRFNSGIVLLSGPTGSGKTTTLFAILNELSSESLNIITVENPVEYQLKTLNQIEINNAQGLSFNKVLPYLLRQDPDVIMIGEIRDKKTAEIAVRAAVTGHLVLSTIHTTDAVSAVVRLIDMGIPAYLISSTLNAVVAQRLLRKLCLNCRKKISEDNYEAVGCSNCSSTGYKGRTPAAEILIVNQEIRNLINQHKSRNELKETAMKSGMKTLREAAEVKISSGKSTKEELLRVVNLSS